MAMRLEIKERKANGKYTWCVDLRPFGRGRKFFPMKADAERFLTDHRRESGLAWADITDVQRIEFVAAHHRLAAVGATVSDATEFFLKHRGSSEQSTLQVAINSMLSDKLKAGRRPKYVEKLRWSLKPLGARHGEKLCNQVSHADVEAWLNGNGWSAGTRKYAINDARTLFAYCQKRGWCSLDPTEGIETPVTEDKPPEILTVADCRKLIATAKQKKYAKLLPYCALALFCGIRPEEIRRLDWSMVRVKEKHVEVPALASKTRQRRIVQLQPNVVALIKAKKSGRITPKNFRRYFESLRAEAKVKWSHDCMRHSFASYHMAAFGSADKTATEMGHRNTQMLFKHYRELVRPAEAKAFWKIR